MTLSFIHPQWAEVVSSNEICFLEIHHGKEISLATSPLPSGRPSVLVIIRLTHGLANELIWQTTFSMKLQTSIAIK